MFFDFEYLCKTNVTCLHDYQMIEHFPLFYKEIFVFFNECKKFKSDMSLNALLKEPLWCNKIFVLKNKPVFFKEWLKSGIKYLNDIVNENGLKLAECKCYKCYFRSFGFYMYVHIVHLEAKFVAVCYLCVLHRLIELQVQ